MHLQRDLPSRRFFCGNFISSFFKFSFISSKAVRKEWKVSERHLVGFLLYLNRAHTHASLPGFFSHRMLEERTQIRISYATKKLSARKTLGVVCARRPYARRRSFSIFLRTQNPKTLLVLSTEIQTNYIVGMR